MRRAAVAFAAAQEVGHGLGRRFVAIEGVAVDLGDLLKLQARQRRPAGLARPGGLEGLFDLLYRQVALEYVKLTRPQRGCAGTNQFIVQGLAELGVGALDERRQPQAAQVTGLQGSRLGGIEKLDGDAHALPALGADEVDLDGKWSGLLVGPGHRDALFLPGIGLHGFHLT